MLLSLAGMGETVRRPVHEQQVLWFGGDYNPEQWPAGVLADDLAAFEQLGVNTVTLPVFAWARLQPAESTFTFDWLDQILDQLDRHGIGVVLATPTAAQPAWLSAARPEILPVDRAGRRRRHGARCNYCPTSTAYREAAAGIADEMARRYAGHRGLRLWHVNNEYGPVCYCDGCRSEFQRWLRDRYGDLDALNEAWGTAVWGHTLGDWSEIELPSDRNALTLSAGPWERPTWNPSISLDHARFASTMLLECFLGEKEALRRHSPDVPVTTNFHGPVAVVDWHQWGPHLDLVSWDSYPLPGSHWATAAFGHDLARGAGAGDDFLLMEASAGAVNWHPTCSVKRPGEVRRQAVQAIARGSRGSLFFQIRQARSGHELNHSAMIPRHGRLDTRMGRELAVLAADLRAIGVLPDTHVLRSRVALIFDWPSWWAHDATPGLDQEARYLSTISSFHQVLADHHQVTDVVGARGDGWRHRDVVVAPLLHIVDQREAAALAAWVDGGGTLITTTGSGIAGSDGRIHSRGLEPTWARLLGIWVEETDVQPAEVANAVLFDDGTVAAGRQLFDIVRLDTASPVATFQDDFYSGSPAVTVNRHGQGRVVYLASPTAELFAAVVDRFVDRELATNLPGGGHSGVDSRGAGQLMTGRSANGQLRGRPVGAFSWVDPPVGIERVEWVDGESADESSVVFLINHGTSLATLPVPAGGWTDLLTCRDLEGELELEPGSIVVARRAR
jgi:beta-galactosidase